MRHPVVVSVHVQGIGSIWGSRLGDSPATVTLYFFRFQTLHFIRNNNITSHVTYRASHPYIALAQWEANLQLTTFSFSIPWPQWLKTGCQNESTTNICLCGGWWPFLSFHSPSVVRIDNRVNFFLLPIQCDIFQIYPIHPTIQLLDCLVEWLMTSQKNISFIYLFC